MSGCDRTRWTSSPRAATWSSTTWNRCQVTSVPADAATRSRSSASVLLATAQRVCGTTRMRSTLSRCTPRTSASIAWGVIRPPGLRKIFASPALRPSIRSGSMRESMQVTMATPAWATPSNPDRSKSAANSRLAASRSSKLTSGDVSRRLPRGAQQVAGRDGPGPGRPEQQQGQDAGDDRADGRSGEDGVLLGDAGDLEEVRELVAARAPAAHLPRGGDVGLLL